MYGKCIIHGLSIWNMRRQFAASHQLVTGSAWHWGNNSIKLQLSATAEQATTGSTGSRKATGKRGWGREAGTQGQKLSRWTCKVSGQKRIN